MRMTEFLPLLLGCIALAAIGLHFLDWAQKRKRRQQTQREAQRMIASIRRTLDE